MNKQNSNQEDGDTYFWVFFKGLLNNDFVILVIILLSVKYFWGKGIPMPEAEGIIGYILSKVNLILQIILTGFLTFFAIKKVKKNSPLSSGEEDSKN